MIISPKEPVTKTIAYVYSDDNNVYIKFPESNEDFKDLIKNRLYFWDGWSTMRWCKKTRHPEHRHPEIIRLLLENGFIVESDEDNIKKAQLKDYIPESTRWVSAKDDKFRFCWYWNEDCYDEVRKLPASHYDKPCVTIPMEYYEEVIDFCEINGFDIKQSARNLIEQAKQKLNNILFFNCEEEYESVKTDNSYDVHPDLIDV